MGHIIITPQVPAVRIVQDGRMVTVQPVVNEIRFSQAGVQGPAGPTGGDTAILGETRIADGAVGGHRVVVITPDGVSHASATTLGHATKIYGITLGAAGSGDEVQVVTRGRIEESSWAWTPDGPLFFSGDGVLTQSVPTNVYSVRVGTALSATVIFVELGEPIILN